VFALLAAALASFAAPPPLFAAESGSFPNRPIRVLVGFSPGGSADLTARSVAQKMTEILGQTVVVENRAGASGMIAAEAVARAEPDGYTLFEPTMTTHGIGPNLYKKIPYDPVGSFEPISLMVSIPLVMFTHTSVPAKTVKELVAVLKANPDKYRYASAGNGSPPHLAAELFKLKSGVPPTTSIAPCAKRLRTSASCMAWLMTALSRSTTARGVPLGASMPYQSPASMPL
jgi:tripartite-type tricarboxylate transporter receptor subunit TctC